MPEAVLLDDREATAGHLEAEVTTDELADRILGAKIVAIADEGDGKSVILDFEHRGTDDNSGSLLVAIEDVAFHV